MSDTVDEDEIKVEYRTREGYKTTAYIDPKTGHGSNKHTGTEVIVQWSEEDQIWIQIDNWTWVYRTRTETFEREN